MDVGRRGKNVGGEMRTVPLLCWAAVAVTVLCCTSSADGTMDITAFEYFRKFGKHLELGECPQREVLVTQPDNTTVAKLELCKARQRGNITNLVRKVNDTRHVLIPSANDLVAYLGLCGGEAASYLGILNSGDCVAVEIASNLTFSRKTMVRAYVEYYRTSLDILNSGIPAVREGFSQYVENKFYVRNRDYGTLEIILVQFRFRTQEETDLARGLKPTSTLMSEYMKKLEREVGKPKNVVMLSLSTATEKTYRMTRYDVEQWGAAVRDVEVRELEVAVTRGLIDNGRIRPHLTYQLAPFIRDTVQASRTSGPLTWEATSMIEVSLRVSLNSAKKTEKLCDKPNLHPGKLCRRVRELKLKLEELQAEIHKGRASWMDLTTAQRQEFSSRYSSRVTSYSSVTENLSRAVRRMKKQEKLEKAKRKKNERNQVQVPELSTAASRAGRIGARPGSDDAGTTFRPVRRLRHKLRPQHLRRMARRRLSTGRHDSGATHSNHGHTDQV